MSNLQKTQWSNRKGLNCFQSSHAVRPAPLIRCIDKANIESARLNEMLPTEPKKEATDVAASNGSAAELGGLPGSLDHPILSAGWKKFLDGLVPNP